MQSIEIVKGSDGSGNANVATIQNTRAPLASTIIVDTVLGINPTGFAGSMGTPHTFTDPITSETITVISEATAVDFVGHVDGSNLEIDTIAPGYTDAGSAVGDIVIIRPTTQYADNLADVLAAAHDDDGTLKAGAVDAAAVLASNVVTTPKILNAAVTADKLADIVQGAAVATSETTTSTSYTDLATTTDTCTVLIGANGKAKVSLQSYMANSIGAAQCYVSVGITGANTIAATDINAIEFQSPSGNVEGQLGTSFLLTGLTPGSTTFKMKYKVATGGGGSGTGTFKNRRITVEPV